MIIELTDTSTQEVTRTLRSAREERGEVSTGRVLTFVVMVSAPSSLGDILEPVNEAAREHPARVIILVDSHESPNTQLDAQIHLGGDSGASEVIALKLHGELAEHTASVVTPLLLPDTPVVVWWPADAPRNVAADQLGQLAARRITDANRDSGAEGIYRSRMIYASGDSDLGWSRITLWRGLLASTLDQPPFENVLSVEIAGPAGDASVDLAAGWLADRLSVPVTRTNTDSPLPPVDDQGVPMVSIEKTVMRREDADVTVEIKDSKTAAVSVGDRQSLVALSPRGVGDCLAEELRHLDPDYAYGRALRGMVRVNRPPRGSHTDQVTKIYEDMEGQESQR